MSTLVERVGAAASDAFRHGDFTLGRLLRTVNVPRHAGEVPVAPVLFNLDPEMQPGGQGDVALRSLPRSAEYFELFLNLTQVAEGGLVMRQKPPEVTGDPPAPTALPIPRSSSS